MSIPQKNLGDRVSNEAEYFTPCLLVLEELCVFCVTPLGEHFWYLAPGFLGPHPIHLSLCLFSFLLSEILAVNASKKKKDMTI